MKRGGDLRRGKPMARGKALHSRTGLKRGRPLRQVSKRRASQNRERAAVIAAMWPERPWCGRLGCLHMADDIHEPLTRARGGSIKDPGNCVPLCRSCHDEITFRPESELEWAYSLGLLMHSWDAGKGVA